MSFQPQFFSSSQSGTVTSQGAAASSPAKARGEERQCCLPVTVRAIEEALRQEGEELSFHGIQPETLVLVAAVESLKKQPNNLDLVVNDSSGRIRVRHFLTGEANSVDEGIQEGRYVYMFGQVRSKPELHFMAQGIRPVKSADEVSYHAIEVGHAALRLQRGPSAAGGQAPALATPSKAAAGSDLMAPALTPAKIAAAPAPEQPAAAPAAAPSGKALRDALMAFLTDQAESKGDEGCSRSEVHGHFKAAAGSEVDALLAEMVQEGDAITTIDEEHFAAM